MDQKLKLMEGKQNDVKALQGIEDRIEQWKNKIEEVLSKMSSQINQLREKTKDGNNFMVPTSESQKNFTLNMNQDMFNDQLAENITGIS